MEEDTLKAVISGWKVIHDTLRPSVSLKTREQQALSVFSSRREYWEFFVTAVGYTREYPVDKQNLMRIVEQMREDPLSETAISFRTYSTRLASLPFDNLIAAGDSLSQTGVLREAFLEADKGLEILANSFRFCRRICGDNQACIRRCLKNR